MKKLILLLSLGCIYLGTNNLIAMEGAGVGTGAAAQEEQQTDRVYNPEDNCPICYDKLIDPAEEQTKPIVSHRCHTSNDGRDVYGSWHAECLKNWLETTPSRKCLNCNAQLKNIHIPGDETINDIKFRLIRGIPFKSFALFISKLAGLTFVSAHSTFLIVAIPTALEVAAITLATGKNCNSIVINSALLVNAAFVSILMTFSPPFKGLWRRIFMSSEVGAIARYRNQLKIGNARINDLKRTEHLETNVLLDGGIIETE